MIFIHDYQTTKVRGCIQSVDWWTGLEWIGMEWTNVVIYNYLSTKLSYCRSHFHICAAKIKLQRRLDKKSRQNCILHII